MVSGLNIQLFLCQNYPFLYLINHFKFKHCIFGRNNKTLNLSSLKVTKTYFYFYPSFQTLYVASALIKCVWSTCAGNHCGTTLQPTQTQYPAMQTEEDGNTSKLYFYY